MISFTICSNNYIYKARVLAASIKSFSPAEVYLFLADHKEEKINYEGIDFDEVIFLDELPIPNLQWMKENYDVVELNTAIKPFAFKYLFDHFNASEIVFFDPDVKVYQPINGFGRFWGENSILLTPHILTPMPFDGKFPLENLFLNHGIYNLGFLALKRSVVVSELLAWWQLRSLEKCIIDLREGYFVDQLWFNLVPVLFQSTTVINHYGCNMAYWNLHERNLSFADGRYIVNGAEPLFFYHFSGVDDTLENIKNIPDFRYSFEERPVLRKLYQEYLSDVGRYDAMFYRGFTYFDGRYPVIPSPPSRFSRLVGKLKRSIKNA